MESLIDERYRLMLMDYYLENPKEQPFGGVSRKWHSFAPSVVRWGVQMVRRGTVREHFCGVPCSTLGCSRVPRREALRVLGD